MSTIPAPQPDRHKSGRGSRIAKAATTWSPITAAIVGALVAGLFAVGSDIVKTRSENREKRLALETTLASDMNRSFTTAIAAGRRIGTGLVYGPTTVRQTNRAIIQGEYNRGLGQWLVNRGRVKAELFARFPGSELASDWSRYARAVEQFFRLGAVIPGYDRDAIVKNLKAYAATLHDQGSATFGPKLTAPDWHALDNRPNRALRRQNLVSFYTLQHKFRSSYKRVSEVLFALGDRFVERMLTQKPSI